MQLLLVIFFFLLYWCLVDLQRISFCCTAKLFDCIYIFYIIFKYSLSQDIENSSLSYSGGLWCLGSSVLNMSIMFYINFIYLNFIDFIYTHTHTTPTYIFICACIYVYICVYIYVCVCLYIYIVHNYSVIDRCYYASITSEKIDSRIHYYQRKTMKYWN